jgi:Xaa-Pro aminopeptidase
MIRPPVLLAAPFLLLGSPAGAQLLAVPEAPVRYEADIPSADFHRGRRDAVLDGLPREAVAVVLGGVEGRGSVDDLQEFDQNPDLYYLTGTLEAGSVLVLAPGGVTVDGRTVREILFVPPRDPSLEIWLGRRFGPARAERVLGVEMALDNDRFEEVLVPLLAQEDRKAYLLDLPAAVPPNTPLAEQTGVVVEAIQNAERAFDDERLPRLLQGLREIKTDEELTFLRRAVDITADAHREVLTSVEAGWTEYEIEALIEYTFHRLGSEQPGFPSIVASGENTVLLHYESNRRTTRPGDLVVMDIGASYRGYTADVTRTVPVDGRFTQDQRTIYDIVLAAQKAGIDAARAGESFGAPGEAASRVLVRGLAKLGLVRSDRDFLGLSRFFPHATSHHVGLQVHDVGSYGPLREGMVITVEPGIYIAPAEDVDSRWWNIGVRIEDDVLVTGGDPVVLSAGAPKDPGEIERLMGEGR